MGCAPPQPRNKGSCEGLSKARYVSVTAGFVVLGRIGRKPEAPAVAMLPRSKTRRRTPFMGGGSRSTKSLIATAYTPSD